MKKMIAILLVGGFLSAGLIGCGPPAETTGPGTSPTKEKTTPPAGETSVKGKAKADATDTKVTVGDTDVTLTADTKFSGDATKASDIKKDWTIDATVKDGKATAVKATKP